jgi:hypothetical protein
MILGMVEVLALVPVAASGVLASDEIVLVERRALSR